jgi:hypothetical protein
VNGGAGFAGKGAMDPDALLDGGAGAPFGIVALRTAIMFVVALGQLKVGFLDRNGGISVVEEDRQRE